VACQRPAAELRTRSSAGAAPRLAFVMLEPLVGWPRAERIARKRGLGRRSRPSHLIRAEVPAPSFVGLGPHGTGRRVGGRQAVGAGVGVGGAGGVAGSVGPESVGAGGVSSRPLARRTVGRTLSARSVRPPRRRYPSRRVAHDW
jgi:hypothetical protein